ncbi:effector-associated constant component EACC1 [Actinomadura fulvescens]|uniref:effector-associated constant component EACC1 n=1 Tax=Actinomadura fulvescens TaxID=46160 RepID=UPI003979582D
MVVHRGRRHRSHAAVPGVRNWSAGFHSANHSALLHWLRTERRLAGLVRARQHQPGPEELGGALDVVMVAVSSGGVVAVLAQMLPAWIRSRRPAVRFTLTTQAGDRLELEASDAAEASPLIAQFADGLAVVLGGPAVGEQGQTRRLLGLADQVRADNGALPGVVHLAAVARVNPTE